MNGKFVDWKDAKIHVLTHGLHYGTAIFEGMRCYDTPNGPGAYSGWTTISRDSSRALNHTSSI